jgi:hypothetical protein
MPIILEADNAEVVTALQRQVSMNVRGTFEWRSWSPVMAEIRGTFECIQQVQVHKVERVCNRAAHDLAKLAMSSRVDLEWILHTPPMISELLRQECNPLFR